MSGVQHLFDLSFGQATQEKVIEDIKSSAVLRSANLWVLLLAILIASVGLNLNSTAVIIGAMLISPLMGPIMAIGLAVSINDFELLRKASVGLGIAAGASILVSSIYFALSPLNIEGNELLTRTSPTAWDALIAIFGGLAGAVGITRNEKTNVIPGVAIATALMPPLCTAGYGIATGNFSFFAGALYLFYVNSICIALGTLIICRALKYSRVTYLDPVRRTHVRRTIILILTLSLLPSAYFGYNLVKKTIFEKNATAFIEKEIKTSEARILSNSISYDKKNIEVMILGKTLNQEERDRLKMRLAQYDLGQSTLTIQNGLDMSMNLGAKNLSEEDRKLKERAKAEQLLAEMKTIYPEIESLAISSTNLIDNENFENQVTLVYIGTKKRSLKFNVEKIVNWLQVRTGGEVKILVD
ncbi:DUF389 domain-containing protein [Leptospira sp. 201903071]|uniref:DUF389 domain-containing protein n=1 Tax=Leptospira ainazelensis TaxID=2810034 RepID=UPI0019629153|nr:DUF389 domain-containing protein [Leptospira ainazelensis]MBM9501505.1 DUF389 domain-containing protein [Leptospira ainazelensis]